MQLEMADFAPIAATWHTRTNITIWCSTGWRTRWNMHMVSYSCPFILLCENMPSPEARNIAIRGGATAI